MVAQVDGGAESLLQDTEVIQRLPGPGSCYLPRLKRQPQQVVLPESMGQARIRSLSSVSGANRGGIPTVRDATGGWRKENKRQASNNPVYEY